MHHIYGEIFKKPQLTGLFLPWTREPVILAEARYFLGNKGTFNQASPINRIMDFSNVKANIYDETGKLVVRGNDAKLLRTQHTYPTKELEILDTLAQVTIADLSAWRSNETKPDPYDVVMNQVISKKEYYQNPSRIYEYEHWIDMGIVGVLRMSEYFLKPLLNFIGEDHWTVHECYQNGTDMQVHKLIDYRIQEWTRLKEQGII